MDAFDHAQALELAEYKHTQARGIMTLPLAPSAKYCTDPTCGTEIPEARRLAILGVQLCAECQSRRERKNTMRGIR